jgi:hypothetical protein
LWFALSITATFVYGLESWRRHAARAAERGENARFLALARCALGPDAAEVLRSVGATRRRLRALAMGSSLDPSPAWLDRCVPLARRLAVHAAEVENTRAPHAAGTALVPRTRALALALGRVGAVWQARAGDPSEDFAPLAEHLVATHAELQLATHSPGTEGGASGLVAPAPWRPAPTQRLALPGAVFLAEGTPARFLVGTPPPLFSRVRLTPGGLTQEVVPQEDARQWHTPDERLVRVGPPGLSHPRRTPVTVEGPTGTLLRAEVALPLDALGDPRRLTVDAVSLGGVPWVLSAVDGSPPVLWRAAARPSAAALGPAASPRPAPQDGGAPLRPSIALTTEGTSIVAAWAEHALNEQRYVRVYRAARDGHDAVNVVVTPGDWAVAGRRVGLAFCARPEALWLFVGGRDQWLAGVVQGGRVREVLRAPRTRGAYGEAPVVRCADEVLVYDRERPRQSPLWRCAAPGAAPRCEALPTPPAPEPLGLGTHETPGASGRPVAHPEWPLVFALAPGGAVLSARAAGPVVSLARIDRGAAAWGPEEVLWDAQGEDAGGAVTDVALYSDPARVVLAVSARDELRVTHSLDGGRTWERP